MKPDQLYQELKDLAERMQITVSEQNLKTSGIKVQSGLCSVKGQNLFIMDKHKSVHKKIYRMRTCILSRPYANCWKNTLCNLRIIFSRVICG
jgi:hypothetical protein